MHEEPTPTNDDRRGRDSSPRIRQRTMLGMPPGEEFTQPIDVPEDPARPQTEPPPPPPASLASARRRKGPQKTMLGIPRPELPDPHGLTAEAAPEPSPEAEVEPEPPARQRAHVRYDSILEPPPVTTRRRRVFLIVGVLVALSAGWLIYRFVNV